jgi:predicted RNA-binding Zn ribbon-like protein
MSLHPRQLSEIRRIGGRPSLDFVNTIHERHVQPLEDYLCGDQRYVEWAMTAGLLDRSEALRVGELKVFPANLMSEVRHLRHGLYEIFKARALGYAADTAAIDVLDRWVQRGWRASQVVNFGSQIQLVWRADAVDIWLPLKRIALDALEVVRSIPRERIKECASTSGCGWLFLDDTKNNSRRWCSMDTCGTPEKMRRYRGSSTAGS